MTDLQAQSLEKYLNKEFIEGQVLNFVDPAIRWLGLLPAVGISSKAIAGRKELYSKKDDPKRRKQRRHIQGAKFAHVTISGMETVNAALYSEGIMAELDRDAIDYETDIDELDRLLQHMGYWLVDYVNTTLLGILTDEVYQEQAGDLLYDNKNGGSPTPAWSDENAKVVSDLNQFRRDMKQETLPLVLGTVFVDDTNYGEAVDHIINLNASDSVRQAFGAGNLTDTSMTIPILGNLEVVEVMSGISEGSMLGLARGMSPATLYYTTVGRYLSSDERGRKIGLNVKVGENDDGNYEIRMWTGFTTLVKYPRAGIYIGAGI